MYPRGSIFAQMRRRGWTAVRTLGSGTAHVNAISRKNILGSVASRWMHTHTYTENTFHVRTLFVSNDSKFFHPVFHKIFTTYIGKGIPSCIYPGKSGFKSKKICTLQLKKLNGSTETQPRSPDSKLHNLLSKTSI